MKYCLEEYIKGLKQHRLWTSLAYRSLKRPYRRTSLKLAWLPLSDFIHIAVLGSVYLLILGRGNRYMSYFAAGWLVWSTITRALGMAKSLWISNAKYIKHMKIEYSIFYYMSIYQTFISLTLSFPTMLLFIFLDGGHFSTSWFLIIPGIILLLLNLFWIIIIISLLSARYRDFTMFLPQIIFMAFLLTPIIWQAERLGDYQWIVDFNPIYHLIQVIRAPLLGNTELYYNWLFLIITAVVGNILAAVFFCRQKRNIVFWV